MRHCYLEYDDFNFLLLLILFNETYSSRIDKQTGPLNYFDIILV